MKFFKTIDRFFGEHKASDLEWPSGRPPLTYTYSYLAPLPFPRSLPKNALPLGWSIKVAIIQMRIFLNLFAAVKKENTNDLEKELDDVVRAVENEQTMKAIAELVDFLVKLSHRHDIFRQLASDFKRIIYQLVRDDNNQALAFWMLFSDFQDLMLQDAGHIFFNDVEEYNKLYTVLELPEYAHRYDDDLVFAQLRVAGPNPTLIEKMTEPLPNFPVTNAHYQQVMGADDDLQSAYAENRVFVVNYKILDGAVAGSYPGPQKYTAAPIGLFAVPKKGDRHLRVIAIQCGQNNSDAFPIITPPQNEDEDAKVRWAMAKAYFQMADATYHEPIAHLGQTHLVCQPFAIATYNVLGTDHPVGRLLRPHFEGTLNINNSAQGSLIAPEGVIDQIMAPTIDMDRVAAVIGNQAYTRNFDQCYFEKTLKKRGVFSKEELPYYPYRDCGLTLWDCIREWVSDYITVYYPNENDPASDGLLQRWHAEVTSHEGGRIGHFGEDGALKTRTYLIDALTMVIWTASAGHAAVNVPQWYIMSYTPGFPLALYAPPPSASRTYTWADYMKMLPPLRQALLQMNTGVLLGSVFYTSLGKYPSGYFSNSDVQKSLNRFQQKLSKIEDSMIVDHPEYIYMRPSKVPQSINI